MSIFSLKKKREKNNIELKLFITWFVFWDLFQCVLIRLKMHKKRSRVSVINLSTVIQTWSQPDNFHQILSDWRRLKFNKHSLHKAGISLWDRLIWRYSTATQIWIVLKVFIIVDHDLLLLGFLYQGTLDIPSCRIYYLSKFHVLLWKKKRIFTVKSFIHDVIPQILYIYLW